MEYRAPQKAHCNHAEIETLFFNQADNFRDSVKSRVRIYRMPFIAFADIRTAPRTVGRHGSDNQISVFPKYTSAFLNRLFRLFEKTKRHHHKHAIVNPITKRRLCGASDAHAHPSTRGMNRHSGRKNNSIRDAESLSKTACSRSDCPSHRPSKSIRRWRKQSVSSRKIALPSGVSYSDHMHQRLNQTMNALDG